MMLRDKMLSVISEVNAEIAERERLTEYIANALLTRKNLFILGDTGQAKSYAINRFRARITGARQFERLLSKQADEEQLFGRLDLGSLIPGSAPHETLDSDATYQHLLSKLAQLRTQYANNPGDDGIRQALELLTERITSFRKTLSELHSGEPRVITTGKIPDCEIILLDEIFKANDGILNALLTALNERRYTNEGYTADIPAISFFAASNEIPNFSDPAESILRPLYDRFELKVVTEYVQDRAARLQILQNKQNGTAAALAAFITLDELYQMQAEVADIAIPASINELMDDILCELRRNNVHISDRKYFGYSPIAQAKAWLRGSTAVEAKDMLALSAYLWTKPEEIPEIDKTLARMCENPLKEQMNGIRAMALEALDSYENSKDSVGAKALVKFRGEIVNLFRKSESLKNNLPTDSEKAQVEALLEHLEQFNQKAYSSSSFTYTPLSELAQLS